MHLAPSGLGCCLLLGGDSVVVDSLIDVHIVGVLCLFHVLLCIALCPFKFCNLELEERADCFTLFVFVVSCDCYCSFALPQSAMGRSAVCDCGIS